MEDAPRQRYRLIRKLIPGAAQPFLRGFRKRFLSFGRPTKEPFRSVFPFTQAHPIRQRSLLRLAREIEANDIPGDLIECGVLDGGMSALMAYGCTRDIHMFDSWEGLPQISKKDGSAAHFTGDIVGSISRVKSVMRSLRIEPTRLHFHKGWFDLTFPTANIAKAALVHIDADLYDSVRLSIETWFPKLSPGGYMQFDDYSAFIGCKRAVDEFLVNHPEIKLQTVDDVGFFIQKPLSPTGSLLSTEET